MIFFYKAIFCVFFYYFVFATTCSVSGVCFTLKKCEKGSVTQCETIPILFHIVRVLDFKNWQNNY